MSPVLNLILPYLLSLRPPPTPHLGEHLRICPQGYTCCTSAMEDNLATLSRKEMEGLLKDAGRAIQTSLTTQYKAFDGESVNSVCMSWWVADGKKHQ